MIKSDAFYILLIIINDKRQTKGRLNPVCLTWSLLPFWITNFRPCRRRPCIHPSTNSFINYTTCTRLASRGKVRFDTAVHCVNFMSLIDSCNSTAGDTSRNKTNCMALGSRRLQMHCSASLHVMNALGHRLLRSATNGARRLTAVYAYTHFLFLGCCVFICLIKRRTVKHTATHPDIQIMQ